MSMMIEGISCFGAFGSGPVALDAALSGQSAAFSPEVDTSPLAHYVPAKALRQCDHFSRLALLGAYTAIENAKIVTSSQENNFARHGIILASGYCTATPTFELIDSLESFGEAMMSPLIFAYSVQNIPAAIIAKNLGVVGPCSTVCQLEAPVSAGLILAQAWLNEGRVDRVLFGAVEEVTPTLVKLTKKLIAKKAGREDINILTRKDRPIADGAVFFCLSRDGKGIGRIDSVTMSTDLDAYPAYRSSKGRVGCFLSGRVPPALRQSCGGVDGSAAYGNLPVAQAFDCVAALSLLSHAENTDRNVICVEYGQDINSVVTLTGS